nr:PREDICTED: uncharacterized protein LOC109031763 [Bemisia tabaci]
MEWFLKNTVTQEEVYLSAGENKVGRQQGSRIHCPSVYSSRHHCIIEVCENDDEFIKVKDLKSSNGTYLNSQRILAHRRTDVCAGDTLGIGVGNDEVEGELYIFQVCKKEKKPQPSALNLAPEPNGPGHPDELSRPGPSRIEQQPQSPPHGICNPTHTPKEVIKKEVNGKESTSRKRKELENVSTSAPKMKRVEVKFEPSTSNGPSVPNSEQEEIDADPPQPKPPPTIPPDPEDFVRMYMHDKEQMQKLLKAIQDHTGNNDAVPSFLRNGRPSLDATKLNRSMEIDTEDNVNQEVSEQQSHLKTPSNSTSTAVPLESRNGHIGTKSSYTNSIQESDNLLNASKHCMVIVKPDPVRPYDFPGPSSGAQQNPDVVSISSGSDEEKEVATLPSAAKKSSDINSAKKDVLSAIELFNSIVPDEDDLFDNYEEEDSKSWYHQLSQSSMSQIIEIEDSDDGDEETREQISGVYSSTIVPEDGAKPFMRKPTLLTMLNDESDTDVAMRASVAKRLSRSVSSSGDSDARPTQAKENTTSAASSIYISSESSDTELFVTKKRLSIESSPEPEDKEKNAQKDFVSKDAVSVAEDKLANMEEKEEKHSKLNKKGSRKAEMIEAVPLPQRKSHLRGISADNAHKLHQELKNKAGPSRRSDKKSDKGNYRDKVPDKEPRTNEELINIRKEKLRELSEKEKLQKPKRDAPKPHAPVKAKDTKKPRGSFLTESETASVKSKAMSNLKSAEKALSSMEPSTSKIGDKSVIIKTGPRKRVSHVKSQGELEQESSRYPELTSGSVNIINGDKNHPEESESMSAKRVISCSDRQHSSGKMPRIPKKRKGVTFAPDNLLVTEFLIEPLEGVKKFNAAQAKAKDAEVKVREQFESEDIIKLDILHWRPSWIHEQKLVAASASPPPVGLPLSLKFVKENFTSPKEYYQIMKPLLHHEVWASVSQAYDRSFSLGQVDKSHSLGDKCTFGFMIESCSVKDVPQTTKRYLQLNCNVVLFEEDIRNNNCPRKDDLVIVRLKFHTTERYKNAPDMYFGLVVFDRRFSKFSESHSIALQPLITSKTKKGKPCAVLLLKVLLNYGNFLWDKKIVTDVALEMKRIKSIIPELRLYDALRSIPSYPLRDAILAPESYDFSIPGYDDSKTLPYSKFMCDLNSSQFEAVNYSVKMCLSPKPNVCLIQGAPGTGKSLVITCIIQQLLRVLKTNHERCNTILVCASSNAAVDELVSKLGETRKTLGDEKFSLVRVGTGVSPKGHNFSLSALVQRNEKQRTSDSSFEQLKMDLELVKAKKNAKNLAIKQCEDHLLQYKPKAKLERDIAILKRKEDDLKKFQDELRGIETEEQQLLYLMKHFNTPEAKKRRQNRSKDDNEEDFLRKAQVVAVTLSSCLTTQMKSVFTSENYSEGSSKLPISVCIIDEATQCTEPEALIPLLLGTKSLILVGDPNQLSPTVLSPTCLRYGFGQSMFSRLYSTFTKSTTGKRKPLFFLDTQYRMHQEICQWPNNFFYEGKLITHQSANKRSNSSPLLPYVVLSTSCKAEADGETNEEEATIVINLIQEILSRPDTRVMSIGVITPYQKQRKLFLTKLEKIVSIPKNTLKEVEVNTIDSYQGSEKDIIILSTVRTHGVGFLENQQRLNVSLTRAKCSLFICSNFISLQDDEMWKALMEDAKRRNVYKRIYTNKQGKYIQHVMKPGRK